MLGRGNFNTGCVRRALVVGFVALGLAVVFWLPLWHGGGFAGGDVYSFYFPQKVFYAERLQAGEFPLWNNRTGHGYPLIGESQTGAFYPFHLACYRVLNFNTAYNTIHLLHYLLAFVFAVLYAERFGLGTVPAVLCGLVYTYAWFPVRTCHEWAIVGGAWLPAALWCVESFLKTSLWRFAISLSAVLALQMLAGHFQIAWITQLVIVVYVPLRLLTPHGHHPVGRVAVAMISAALVFGYGLAAVQLAPTWELKRLSQRASVGAEFRPESGSIPVWYWSQTVRPWHWYSPFTNRDAELQGRGSGTAGTSARTAETNQVEAHLYFGLIPLWLALCRIASMLRVRSQSPELVWIVLGGLALLYTTGWFTEITRFVPGFNFFRGPGRYGIVTTFAVAMLAGAACQSAMSEKYVRLRLSMPLFCLAVVTAGTNWTWAADLERAAHELRIPNPLTFASTPIGSSVMTGWLVCVVAVGLVAMALASRRAFERSPRLARLALLAAVGVLFAVTFVDFWFVSRLVNYTQIVDSPAIQRLEQSSLRRLLAAHPSPARLFAPGANLPNLLGVAATPVYLPFGPAEYADPKLILPAAPDDRDAFSNPTADQIAWLRRGGVTHILSFAPIQSPSAPVRLVAATDDPLLGPAWARFGEPFFLYELTESRGRASWVHPRPGDSVRVLDYRANSVTIEADSPAGGRLILTDLSYPGWAVTIDGQPARTQVVESMFRAVDVPAGRHTVVWRYAPRFVIFGAVISGAAFLCLAAIAHVRFRL